MASAMPSLITIATEALYLSGFLTVLLFSVAAAAGIPIGAFLLGRWLLGKKGSQVDGIAGFAAAGVTFAVGFMLWIPTGSSGHPQYMTRAECMYLFLTTPLAVFVATMVGFLFWGVGVFASSQIGWNEVDGEALKVEKTA